MYIHIHTNIHIIPDTCVKCDVTVAQHRHVPLILDLDKVTVDRHKLAVLAPREAVRHQICLPELHVRLWPGARAFRIHHRINNMTSSLPSDSFHPTAQ